MTMIMLMVMRVIAVRVGMGFPGVLCAMGAAGAGIGHTPNIPYGRGQKPAGPGEPTPPD